MQIKSEKSPEVDDFSVWTLAISYWLLAFLG